MLDWTESTVLVTGGTGSFGRKFVEVMLSDYRPKKLIVYSRDEWKQHEMQTSGFNHPSLRYFIGDVRDGERLQRAMRGVNVVVHAAALKQVPACEYNPIEAVQTNINGSRCVIDAAIDCGVSHVLALSTDKATAPTNIYGATKLVAEKLFVQANAYSGGDTELETRFACVRYGNVVGSRGSVIPLFQAQRDNGTLTITDARMTRFWITLEQGVRFVIQCIDKMKGGEVFIPKLPSMSVMDVARALAPDCTIETIGIRPGEKLHESLLSEEESRQAVDAGDAYVIVPSCNRWCASHWREVGHSLEEDFAYTSDKNDRWLSLEEMVELVHA